MAASVERIYEMGHLGPVGVILDNGQFISYKATGAKVTVVRLPGPDDLCVCGHPYYLHDEDIDLCQDCFDDIYHSFDFPPKTWEYGWA